MLKFLPSHSYKEFTHEDAARLVFGNALDSPVLPIEGAFEVGLTVAALKDLTSFGLPKGSFKLSTSQNRDDLITDQPDGLTYFEIGDEALLKTAELLRAQHEAAEGQTAIERFRNRPHAHLAIPDKTFIPPEQALRILFDGVQNIEMEPAPRGKHPHWVNFSIPDHYNPGNGQLKRLKDVSYTVLGRDDKGKGEAFRFQIDTLQLGKAAAKKRQWKADVHAAVGILFGDSAHEVHIDPPIALSNTVTTGIVDLKIYNYHAKALQSGKQVYNVVKALLLNSGLPSRSIRSVNPSDSFYGPSWNDAIWWNIEADALIHAAHKKLQAMQR